MFAFQFLRRLPRAVLIGVVLAAPAAWSVAAPAPEPVYRIEVAGLSCPFCAYGIEKSLLKVKGVENVQVHLKEGLVLVSMAEGSELDEATARRAVKDAGFTLGGFERVAGAAAGQ